MKIQFKVQAEAAPIINQMAREAGISVNDLGEIALYAIMGSWQRDKGGKVDPAAAVAGDNLTVLRPPEHVVALPAK